MKNNECNIIKDLIPNYIEKLTSAETTQYIENHLSTCNECKKVFENMTSDIPKNNDSDIKRDIKFAKKYNRKFRFFQITLLILLIIFIISTAKNTIILLSLSKKAEVYQNKTNYNLKYYHYDINSITLIETFNNNDKFLRKLSSVNKDDLSSKAKLYLYCDGTSSTLFFDDIDQKIAYPNSDKNQLPSMYCNVDLLKSDPIYFSLLCIFGNAKSTVCNGIDCYRIEELPFNSSDKYIYIDKNTGMPIRISGDWIAYKLPNGEYFEYNTLQDFYYEWDTVTDEDITLPDINEYIIEN